MQDSRTALMSPSDYQAGISEYTKFSNREGIFGDPGVMSAANGGQPTYDSLHTSSGLCMVRPNF